jgi:hypothetical protein
MELIDIIITTLSIVLVVLMAVLILAFIIYKIKNRNNLSLLQEVNFDESNEVVKKMREVVKSGKPQRYKVINENIIPSSTINQKDRININGRFVVYNYSSVREYPSRPKLKFTKWSE